MVCTLAFAQNKDGKEGWRDRMNAEMVAFFTSEVDLSSAEAEKFWPVFNEAKARQNEAFKAMHDAYKALEKAVSEGKGDVASLTKAYLDAQAESNSVFASFLPRFQSILPAEKVAKVYLAEERFRRQQIHNLRPGGKEGKGSEGRRGREKKD